MLRKNLKRNPNPKNYPLKQLLTRIQLIPRHPKLRLPLPSPIQKSKLYINLLKDGGMSSPTTGRLKISIIRHSSIRRDIGW